MLFAALLGFAVACGGNNEKKDEANKAEATEQTDVEANEEATEEATEEVAVEATVEATEEPAKIDDVNIQVVGTADEFNDELEMAVQAVDVKVAEAVEAVEAEATKAANELTVINGANEFKEGSNLTVGGVANIGSVQAM